jgi:predicted component of type VI protein secretion system
VLLPIGSAFGRIRRLQRLETRGSIFPTALAWRETVAVGSGTGLVGKPVEEKRRRFRMDVKLRIVGGPSSGQTIPVSRGKLLIGRAEDCDVRADSEFVSSHHCVLLLDEFTLRIRDLGSRNGTFVNRRQIGTSPLILLHDDMVSIGELSFLVDVHAVHEPSHAADLRALRDPSPTALNGTGLYEDDTVQVERPAAVPPPHSRPLPLPTPPVAQVLPPAPTSDVHGSEPS